MTSFKLNWLVPVLLVAMFCISGTVQAQVPVNNNCANAKATGEVVNLAFDTTNATHDGPGLVMTGPNIWYAYTAGCTGDVTINLEGSLYDTKLAVYEGLSCPVTQGRLVAQNDDFNFPNLYSKVTLAVTAGNKYLIEIGGYLQAKGQGVMTISFPTPCQPLLPNDDCANATPIGNVTDLAFDTTNAVRDCDTHCGSGPNIWYIYTAPCTGKATVSLCGSNFDTTLGIYRDITGVVCPPQHVVTYNDDYCGNQSQVTFDTIAGYEYLIEISGMHTYDTGTGILNVSCDGEYPNQYDLGDAPDSTNNFGVNMIAYDSTQVIANYPTVFNDGTGIVPYGPLHLSPKTIAHLGESVTNEAEADTGTDEDGVNNISPPTKGKNQDKGDDGVVLPVAMPNCDWTTLDYIVNVLSPDPNNDLWVNIWCDWNRDGDWNDDADNDPALIASKGFVSEWAVQNQFLFNLPAGLHQITSPAFLSYHPETGPSDLWMRITLSEQPWTGGSGAAGSGPENGYEFGETEDYFFSPDTTCTVCQDINEDGVVNVDDLLAYISQWVASCP